jgi:glycosyltransferase involved in cell wall biosynthesis
MSFFSIVIPAYNRAHFLGATLNSVLEQDFADFEIIVVDDGSTDDTTILVNQYSIKNQRIKYFKIENSERGAARNFGFQKASGSWVVFLDSDDEFLSGHLSHLKQLIEQFPDCNIFTTAYDFNEDGKIFRSVVTQLEGKFYAYDLFLKGNPFACNVCVRKSATKKIQLFLEDRVYAGMEDWIFLFANTWIQNFYHSSNVTVRMNEHPERSMRFNQAIIQKRRVATQYIIDSFSLSFHEKRKLRGFSFYFYAIHYYLDGSSFRCFLNTIKSIFLLGFKTEILTLLMKSIIGRKWIKKIKSK